MPEGYEFQFRIRPRETKEEAMARVFAQAEAAKRLLLDPDFNAAYQEIQEELVAQIVTSKPGQRELREDCYFRVRGIQEIAYKFNMWAAEGDQLRTHLAEERRRQEIGE